jgi:hypothetical protein
MFSMDFEKYRPGQKSAHEVISSLILDKIVSIVLPTRYGKSDVIRASFLDLYYQGLVSCAIVLSPAINLQRQMVDKRKIDEMLKRYQITPAGSLATWRPTAGGTDAFKQWRSLIDSHIVNQPTLISSTQQFAVLHGFSDTAWLTMWVREVIAATGLPPAFYIDEFHLGSYVNQIGKLAQVLHNAGACEVVLTATPYRADGELMPGFEYELVDYDVIEHAISKATADPNIRLVELRETLKGMYRMKADFEYTFAAAWAEKPSPLAGVEIVKIEADVTKWTEGRELDQHKLLSELKASEAQRVLGKYVIRSNDVRHECVMSAIGQYKRMAVNGTPIGIIVFVGNDTEDEDNHEAKAVLKIFTKLAPELKVTIATSTTDSASERIERFVAGEGDVLIVKMMAGLGLDCPRLKIGVDLSPIRTVASYAQRLMRIATLFVQCNQGVWITPADALAVELFHMLVTSAGGMLERAEASRVLGQEFVEKTDKPEEGYLIDNPRLGEVVNHEQEVGDADFWPQLNVFMDRAVGIANHFSRATIMSAFKAAMNQPAQNGSIHQDINEDISLLKDGIQTYRQKWVAQLLMAARGYGYSGGKDSTYSEKHKECWRKMLTDLRLPHDWDVKVETDVKTLRMVKHYFEAKTQEAIHA